MPPSKPLSVLSEFSKFTFLQDGRNTLLKPVLCAEAGFVKDCMKAYFSLVNMMSLKDFGDIFCGLNSYELGEKKQNKTCRNSGFALV